MGLRDNQGMKVIWSICAIVLTILLSYFLQSISFMFTQQVTSVLQYLVLVFGFISILIMW